MSAQREIPLSQPGITHREARPPQYQSGHERNKSSRCALIADGDVRAPSLNVSCKNLVIPLN